MIWEICMANYQTLNYQTKDGQLLEIRHLTLGDENALASFYHQAMHETKHTLVCSERMHSLDRLQEKIRNAENSFSEIYLGAFDLTKIIGSLQFRVSLPDHPWAKHVGEFGMIVLQNHWNQGIGKRLLQMMEAFAQQINVCRIEAKVRCNNERGVTVYKKAGYKIEGIRERGAFIDGQFVDEYFIAKIL